MFGIGYARFPVGLDIAMLIVMPGGTAVTVPGAGLPQAVATTSSGCFGYELTADQLGLPTLPVGTYKVQLLAGPDLTPVSAPADLNVTALGRQSPGGGEQGAGPPGQQSTRINSKPGRNIS